MRGKRTALAVLAGLLVSGLVAASATSLGGFTNADGTIGADLVEVTSCDNDGATVQHTIEWDATDARNEITAVVVDNVHANCDGRSATVTLARTAAGPSYPSVGTGTLGTIVLVGDAFTVTIAVPPDVEVVTHTALVISGIQS